MSRFAHQTAHSHHFSLLASLILLAVVAFPRSADAQAAENGESTPPPGEEVMRPTERGVRLTPGLSHAISRAWMRDRLWRDVDLSEDQERKVADAAARRMMGIAHRNGQDGASAIEFLIEAIITTDGKFNAQISRELPDKIQPLVKGMREFTDGILEDARPVLDEKQMKQLEDRIELEKRKMDRFERRLQNWREGRYQEGENPFDEYDVEEQVPGQPKPDPRLRNARRQADWEVQRISSWEWSRFLSGAAIMFKFDTGQQLRGDALLVGYRNKADAIQTPEWKARVQKNRMRSNLRWQLGNVPKGPWQYHLDKEFKEMSRPLAELTAQFYKEVLAIATPQQRADAIEEVRRVANQHGLAVADLDMVLLQGLVQPAGAPDAGG